MNLYSFLRKKHSKTLVGALFAVVFFSAFFVLKTPTHAQTVSTYEFSCLFEPFVGQSCDHTSSENDVKNADKSGIRFAKIPANTPSHKYADDTGVNAITMALSLNMDPSKAQDVTGAFDKDYFWNRIADGTGIVDTFVIRISYKDPITGTNLYKLQKIAVKKNETVLSGGTIPIGGVPIPYFDIDLSTNATGDLVQIPFFTENGDNIITKEIVQATINTPGSLVIPYGTQLSADLWYCGGLQNNVSGAPQRDGRYTPRGITPDGGEVEYFTSNGTYVYSDSNGRLTVAYDTDKPMYPDAASSQENGLCVSTTQGAFDPKTNSTRTLRAGTAYYKIGQTINFSIPTKDTVAASQASTIDTGVKNVQDVTDNTLPACAVTVFGDGSLMGCVARVIYYVVYWPIAWVAGIFGKVFDFFLGYSISDGSYRATIIVTGWKLVRDISNIFFIIILIWTGLATVFDFESVSMKKVVPALIVNALLINFSLFGTQVIVDISNITTRLFYNTMTVCQGDCIWKDGPNGRELQNPSIDTVGGYKSLSSKIVASFNPQKIFKADTLNSENIPDTKNGNKQSYSVGGFNSQNSDQNLSSASTKARYTSDYAGYFIVVTLIAAFLMFAIAKMFFGVMFMFLGRTVGLYMVMIFSPFAVLTRGGMPLVGGIKDLEWGTWKKQLFEYALLAPIFVFFLYIIYSFINSDMSKVFVSSLTNSTGFMETVLSVAIPMLIIYMLINEGVTIAKKFAGRAGEMLQKLGSSAAGLATGAAVGIASGGVALAGRGASSMLNKGLGTWAATNKDQGGVKGMLASGTNRFLQWGQKSSFDARNIKIGSSTTSDLLNKGLGGVGLKLKDNVSGNVGLGQKDYLGGNVEIRKKRAERKEKKETRRNDMSHLSDDQAAEVWKRMTERDQKIAGERAWEVGKLKELIEDNSEIKILKTTESNLNRDLKTAEASGNTTNVNILKKQLAENNKAQMAIISPLEQSVVNKKEKLGKDIEKDDLYKNGVDDEKERVKEKYGKDIKNAKDLSSVMRYKYAERMLEDSILLSGGEKRKGLWQTTGLYTLGGLASSLGFYAAAPAALLANYVDSLQESQKAVYKKIINEFDKNIKKNSKQDKIKDFENEIKKIDELIISSVIKHTNKSPDVVKNLDPDTLRSDFNDALAAARQDAEIAKRDYEEDLKEFRSGSGKITKDALNKSNLNRWKTADLVTKLSNAYEKKDNLDEKIEREEERIASAAFREKSTSEAKKPEEKKAP